MKKIFFNFCLILFIFLLGIGNVFANDKVTLKKCVDGDTAQFILNGETIKVRFLAIDTPESVHPTKEVEAYGKEASTYTCEVLTNAKNIELEYESSNKTDKYGRYLAWVWVDDVLLQDDLVSKGYAEVAYLYGKYKYVDLLKDHQAIAQAKKLNIWSDENVETQPNNNTNSTVSSSSTIGNSLIDKIDSPKSLIFFIAIIGILYILYKKNIITKNELKNSIKKLTK